MKRILLNLLKYFANYLANKFAHLYTDGHSDASLDKGSDNIGSKLVQGKSLNVVNVLRSHFKVIISNHNKLGQSLYFL